MYHGAKYFGAPEKSVFCCTLRRVIHVFDKLLMYFKSGNHKGNVSNFSNKTLAILEKNQKFIEDISSP